MTFKQNIKTNFIFLFFVFIFTATLLFDVLIVKSRANMGDMEKGLIAHYPLNEEYGTKDVTPYGRHGANSGATLTTGRKGETNGAYSFDGADDYITINNITFATDTPYSISFWGSTTVAATKFWFGSYNTSTRNFGTVSNKFFYRSLDSTYNYFTGVPVDTTNTFHFYTLVCNGNGSMTLYRDNEIGVTITGITNTTITINAIGRGYNSSAYNHLGKFQDFRVYNRALSATEIKSLYETYQPSLGASSLNKGLVAHYPLNEEYSTEGTTNLWASTNGRPSSLTAGGTTPPTVELINQTTPFGTQVYKVTIPANNATGYSGCRVQGSSTTMYYDGRPYSYFSYVSGDLTGLSIYPTGSRGESSCSYNSTLNKNEWKYYVKENTFDTAGGSGNLYMTWYASTTSTSARIFYIAATQIEQKDHSTPFVSGARNSRIDDKSGNGLHGTNYNVTLATGRKGEINGAYNFNGTSSYIDTNNSNNFNFNTGDFTLMAWVKPNNILTDSTVYEILNKGGEGAIGWGLSIRFGKIMSAIQANGGSNQNNYSNSLLNNNEWNHVVIVHKRNDKIYYYLNGLANGSVSYNIGNNGSVNNSRNALIGGYSSNSGLFPGSIADARVYNRALSATEIKSLYESFKPKLSTGTLNKGLVLNMPLNSLNMQSTTVVSDTTPYENHGTVSGATVGVTETTFDGINDYIDTTNRTLSNNSPLSYSIWIKFSESQSTKTILGRHSNAVGGSSLGIDNTTPNKIKFHLNLYASQRVNSTTTLNDNLWHHVLGTWDGTILRLYIDGVLNNSYAPASTSLTYPALNTQIGRWVGGSAEYFKGSLSGARIYNRALSANEVKLLYDKGRN